MLQAHLLENKLKLIPMLDLLNCRFISLPEHMHERVFINLNTQQDVQRIRREETSNPPEDGNGADRI